MEAVLLAIPMESEFKALKMALNERLEPKTINGISGYTFISKKKGLLFAYESKVGRVNTALDLGILAASLDIKEIINLGSAGALSNKLKPLDVVLATASAYYDVDVTRFGYKYGQMCGCPATFETATANIKLKDRTGFKIHYGLNLTVESFMTAALIDKDKLNKFNDPLCIDMEGAAFGQCAYRLNKPYTLIRAISDSVNNEANELEHEELVTKCCQNAVDVLLELID